MFAATISPNPIYGMQARGLDGAEESFDDTADMGSLLFGGIKEVQPARALPPDLLFSAGLVTLEMARLFARHGRENGAFGNAG